MTENAKNFSQFSKLAHFMEQRMENIPLTFLLGFFVTIVVDRWRNIFANIGFVDRFAYHYSMKKKISKFVIL